MKQTTAVAVMLLFTIKAQAQLRAVVASMETGVPIRDAIIFTTNGADTLSNWDGTFCLKDSFQRFTITHPHFLARVIDAGDFHDGDTIQLIPKEGYLGEVEVWGHRKDRSQSFKLDKTEAALLQKQPSGVDLMGLISLLTKKKTKASSSKKEKLEKVLKDY